MKTVKKLLTLSVLALVLLFNMSFTTTAKASEPNKVGNVEPNSLTEDYRSYAYGSSGQYIGCYDKYWRTDAFKVIWDVGWKGYVLNDKTLPDNLSNTIGVVLWYTDSSNHAVNIDFEKDHYTLTTGPGAQYNDPNFVRGVQQVLSWLGYNPGPIDGAYGPRTEQAVMSFQQKHGLVKDGIVGKATYKELSKADK